MILLIGAGASKPFGIPTTKEMAEDFLSSDISKPLRQDLEHCKDIEDIIKYLSKNGNASLESAYGYIRHKCSVYQKGKPNQIYEPILKLSKSLPLNIFTTNYDTVIEDTCDGLDFKYDDGFVNSKYFLKFDQHSFFRSKIRIFKMHGSVTWYRKEPDQTIFKFPYSLDQTDINELMIYPTKDKDIYTYPYYLFQFYFSSLLNTAEELISIGHSFSDPHILAAVKATLATRNNFRLLIVNPCANDIKERCFRNESNKQIAILNNNFEEWSASMYDEYRLKAEGFIQKSKEYETRKAKEIVAEYIQSDHFKKYISEIYKRFKDEPSVTTSPHFYDQVIARLPIPTFNQPEIRAQMPTISGMIGQLGLGNLSAALIERPCTSCNRVFRRNPVGITTCPYCGLPNA